ncbi:MAG TPA: hypothetical protein VEB59_06620 [Gemmatimonadales bacterium]|nr:hypothetical protein [Gemmatimonadales bacterium]
MRPVVFLVLGWAAIGLSAAFALAMHRADRRMQAYRAPGVRPGAYGIVPLRWKRNLYTAPGHDLVGKAWRSMLLMYVAALAGVVLLSQGVDALP